MKVPRFFCFAIGAMLYLLSMPPLLSQIVQLVWSPSPSSDISHYNVYRSEKINLPFRLIGTVQHPDTAYTDEINTGNVHQLYAVTGVDSAGNESDFSNVVSADGIGGFYLFANYPNPFNPATTIEYSLQNSGRVALLVYNTSGQIVKRILDANQSPGSYRVTWDGTNDQGVRLSSGVYYYRLETSFGSVVRKMIILR